MDKSSIEVSSVTPVIGANITGIDLTQPLSDEVVAGIRDALIDHQVIFFRNQHITPEHHKDLGRKFGSLHVHPVAPGLEGHPEILVLHSDDKKQYSASAWHSDVSCDQEPNMGAILHAKVVPETGGDTMWASMYAAYDALSDKMQKFLSGLEARHGSEHVFGRAKHADDARPNAVHPVIRTHPVTGRQAIFVNSVFTSEIVGMKPRESQAVLQFLYEHIETPEFQCRFEWQPESIAFWDNRCTQHRALADYFPQTRTMYRVTINGEAPFYQSA